MKTATGAVQWLIRVLGVILIVLGLLFWTGQALPLIPVHMLLGLVFAISLWTLAFLAARARVNSSLVLSTVLWGLLVLFLGVTQTRLLTGQIHWLIQILHLLVGLGAIGQAERLAASITHARRLAPQP